MKKKPRITAMDGMNKVIEEKKRNNNWNNNDYNDNSDNNEQFRDVTMTKKNWQQPKIDN